MYSVAFFRFSLDYLKMRGANALILWVVCCGFCPCQPKSSISTAMLPQPRKEAAVTGTWRLISVLTEFRPKNGGKPFSSIMAFKPGTNSPPGTSYTFTANGKWQHHVYELLFEESTYDRRGDSLIINDAEGLPIFRRRILELTSSQLVTRFETDDDVGHRKITETYVRTSLEEQRRLRLEAQERLK